MEQRYEVVLLLSHPAPLPVDALLGSLNRLLPEATGAQDGRGGLRLQPAPEAAPILIGAPTPGAGGAARVEAALGQTWDWPEVAHALEHVVAHVAVTTDESASADRFVRVHRLNSTLRALVEHLPVAAILWVPAQRLVDPTAFVESLAHGGTVTDHVVNLRLFHIADGREGELLMDTIGLASFGLPDLQCHFAGADPGDMGRVLGGYADYLFDKGDVINDDSLIRGIEPFHEWPCERGESLVAPPRPVVDIRPDDLWVQH